MILGRLFDWTLILYGTSSDPLERNQHALNVAVPVHTNNATPVLGKKQISLLLIIFSFILFLLFSSALTIILHLNLEMKTSQQSSPKIYVNNW